MIEIANLSRTFRTRNGEVEALQEVDLRVGPGEFLALIGRSGCGKSTLLRLIAGLLRPTAGTVLIDGQPVGRPRRDVAMVLQRPALLPWRSAVNNVLLPVEVFGWPRQASRVRAHELLEMTGLGSEFHDRLPHELSGGMQQRVALCRALIQQPRVMLMDEPFSALDALTREELSADLQRIHAEYHPTIVLVTHSIDEAVMLADRVAVLSPRPGRLHKVMPIDIPRPRTRALLAQYAQCAAHSAELYELLCRPELPARPSAVEVSAHHATAATSTQSTTVRIPAARGAGALPTQLPAGQGALTPEALKQGDPERVLSGTRGQS